MRLRKVNYLQLIKIAAGSCIAILIAGWLGLNYSASAGIITLLSIQNTKKETFLIAGKRFLSFLISVGIAWISFQLLGFHAFSFGFFLLIFAGVCYLLGLEGGISMNAVLTTHYLIEESITIYWISNELFLFLIGTGIGILLNLYFPQNTQAIRKDQVKIEEEIKQLLKHMSNTIFLKSEEIFPNSEEKFSHSGKMFLSSKSTSSHSEDTLLPAKSTPSYSEETFLPSKGTSSNSEETSWIQSFDILDHHLDEALTKAYDNMNNTLQNDTRYYIQYMQLRKSQRNILKRICSQITSIHTVPKQSYIIAEFLNHIAATFHEYNNAIDLLNRLQMMKSDFKTDPLPTTREEFEDRAILFQILNELEAFLLLKKEFVLSLTDIQLRKYWKAGN